jgi:hypothetical protein
MNNVTITADLTGLEPYVDYITYKEYSPAERVLYALRAMNFKVISHETNQEATQLTVRAQHGGDALVCAEWANGHFRLDMKRRITAVLSEPGAQQAA